MQRTDLLRLVGNTPLVEIRRLNPHANVKIMAKIESRNPGGSIKDRVAVAMIEAAEKSGELEPARQSSRPPAATPAWAWPWWPR